jgi:hypothetical protein
MVVQVDNSKINKQNGVNGTGSTQSTPYMTATQKHFASGGSIWNAPTQNKQSSSDSGSSGGILQQALTGTGVAGSGSNDSDKASADAQKGAGDVNTLLGQFTARVKAGVVKMNKDGKDLAVANKEGIKTDSDLKDLTAQRDTAADELAATPTEPATNDGTGAGKNSAYSLDIATAPLDLTQKPKGKNTSDTTTLSEGTATTAPATATTNSDSSANTEKQAKVDDLNSKIVGKTTQKQQLEEKSQAEIASLKASYQAQINPLKADGTALDQKSTNAANAIEGAQSDEQKAGTVTAVGGTVTAAGSAMCSTGYGASVGAYMVKVGAGATIAGGAWNLKAKSAEGSAKDEQSAAATAKTNLTTQMKLVVSSYAKGISQARKNA